MMADPIPFHVYGFTTNNPPQLNGPWNEEKRVVDLNNRSYVFITSLYSSPWRERNRFPNADRSTMWHHHCKWGERRIKISLLWVSKNNTSFNRGGTTKSRIFGER
jgi:hypothetical protein